MKKILYIKPEIEIVLLKERLMLELPVSNATVDDEAAKKKDIFEENPDDILGPDRNNLWDD